MAGSIHSEQQSWDRVVRVFHWVNVVLILGLATIGTVILNSKALGISNDGKILLKTIHVLIGYAFVTNLLIRLGWAFAGKSTSRWSSFIPGPKDLREAFSRQIPNLFKASGHDYDGHSPLGKISVTLLLLCMSLMAITGLVLAGTDIYFPPLGHWVAQSIAAPGVDPASLVPYRPELVDEAAYDAMRAWRAPFIEIHELTFYTLLFLVPAHVIGVIIAEVSSHRGLVSAMISGRRVDRKPDNRA